MLQIKCKNLKGKGFFGIKFYHVTQFEIYYQMSYFVLLLTFSWISKEIKNLIFFHISLLIRWIQQNKIYKKIWVLTKD